MSQAIFEIVLRPILTPGYARFQEAGSGIRMAAMGACLQTVSETFVRLLR
jgi:hypothetical protein